MEKVSSDRIAQEGCEKLDTLNAEVVFSPQHRKQSILLLLIQLIETSYDVLWELVENIVNIDLIRQARFMLQVSVDQL